MKFRNVNNAPVSTRLHVLSMLAAASMAGMLPALPNRGQNRAPKGSALEAERVAAAQAKRERKWAKRAAECKR